MDQCESRARGYWNQGNKPQVADQKRKSNEQVSERLGRNNQILSHQLASIKLEPRVPVAGKLTAWQGSAKRLCVPCASNVLLQPIYLAHVEKAAE